MGIQPDGPQGESDHETSNDHQAGAIEPRLAAPGGEGVSVINLRLHTATPRYKPERTN